MVDKIIRLSSNFCFTFICFLQFCAIGNCWRSRKKMSDYILVEKIPSHF